MADKVYKRKGYEPDLSDSDNVQAVTDILIDTIKKNRSCAFEDSEQGLLEFKEKTLEYLQYIKETNANEELNKKVMVDIESWACYLGITRATIANYERLRGDNWKHFISVVKNGIAAAKKEAAFHSQLQPMIAVFDLANNHDYKNTSEFKVEAVPCNDNRQALTAAELPKLGENEESQLTASLLPQLENKDTGNN